MALPKVGSFLGCCSVETGASVIGWINFVIDCIKAFIVVLIMLSAFILSCSDIRKYKKDYVGKSIGGSEEKLTEEDVDAAFKTAESGCYLLKGLYLGFWTIVLIIILVFMYIAYLCIKGVRLNEHTKIKPLMIVEGIWTVLGVIGLLSCVYMMFDKGLDVIGSLIFSVIYFVYYAYKFIVLYSAFCKIRDDKWGGRVYTQPGTQPNMQPSMQPMMTYNKA